MRQYEVKEYDVEPDQTLTFRPPIEVDIIAIPLTYCTYNVTREHGSEAVIENVTADYMVFEGGDVGTIKNISNIRGRILVVEIYEEGAKND